MSRPTPPILMQLLHYDGLGNWREINEANAKIQAVTAADLKRVANEYFSKENRAVATYLRKEKKPSEKSDAKPSQEKK